MAELPWESHWLFHGIVSKEVIAWERRLRRSGLDASWVDIELLHDWSPEHGGFCLRPENYEVARVPALEDGAFYGGLSLNADRTIRHDRDTERSLTILDYRVLESHEQTGRRRFLLLLQLDHSGSAPASHILATVALEPAA